MQFNELKHTTEHQFTDITSEEYRTYNFGDLGTVTITEPVALAVSVKGGHRVLDGQGKSYYIPDGWISLEWKAKEGQPQFVK